MADKLILTEEQMMSRLLKELTAGMDLSNEDLHGQVVLYTGYYKQMDGSYSDVEDPEYSDDPTDA